MAAVEISRIKSYFKGNKITDVNIAYNKQKKCEYVESITLENGIVIELWHQIDDNRNDENFTKE